MNSASPDPVVSPSTVPERSALSFIGELSRGDFAHAGTKFDTAMTHAMSPERLKALWVSIENTTGKFTKVEATHLQKKDAYDIVLVTCRFENTRRNLKVVLDEQNQVSGLFHGPVPEDLEASTRALINAAAKGDFSAASRDFGPVLRQALSESAFGDTWKGAGQKVGALSSIERIEVKPEASYWTALATTRFEKDSLVVKVVFDGTNHIVGLFLKPVDAPWTAPSYVKTAAFTEQQVQVGSAPALPGTLSTPEGPGPFPAIILVHGSGPNDRDETIGGNKVFKDVAQGLASQGVAVLRYEKRSRQSPAGIVTQKEEVLDGAHDAIAFLKTAAKVDPLKIYIAGHSQGGNLAPRIAKENPGLAGIVVLAGNTRPLQDLVIDQLSYFSSLQPGVAKLEQSVADARKFKQDIESPSLKADDDVVMPVGGGVKLKGAYFLDMRGYNPAEVAQKLSCRVLVIQGLRDYQVTEKDLQGWRDKLSTQPNAKIIAYPALNHLLISGTGRSTPAEYETAGHVDETLVNDIASWVKVTSGPR